MTNARALGTRINCRSQTHGFDKLLVDQWDFCCETCTETLYLHRFGKKACRGFVGSVNVGCRRLSEAGNKGPFLLPITDGTPDALAGFSWFSTLDMDSGYWKVDLSPEDKKKLAFTIPSRLYEFATLPFGLTNAPTTS